MLLTQWLERMEYDLVQGSTQVPVEDVIFDSRKAKPNTVFVCMKGTKVDSHKFIPAVLEAGTTVIVVEQGCVCHELPVHVTVLEVVSGREALAKLSAARFGYPAEKMVTIGVTGTKGKTTATHMIRTILEHCGKKTGLVGTNGAYIDGQVYPTMNTTPESYELQMYFARMVEAGCEYMVMEVSSQGFKMHRVDGFSFDYGIFTNISLDHIGPDEHESFEEYLYYKSRLLRQCKIGIVNQDDNYFKEITAGAACRIYTYGLDTDSDFRIRELKYVNEAGFVGLEFPVEGSYPVRMRVSIPGRFNAYNALAAVSVCSFLDLPLDQVSSGLEHIRVDGRMEIVHNSDRYTVIVDYAHNALSMESLLKTLRSYNPRRLVCVFGCGGNRSKDRRYFMGEIGGKLADLCIITADNSRFEKVEDIIEDIKIGLSKSDGKYVVMPDRREAIAYSIAHAEPGDMIAVIGKGHEDYQEIEGVRHPFLDKAVIQEVLASLGQISQHQ